MKKKILGTVAIAAAAAGLFFLIKGYTKPKQDYTEYFSGYDDRISFIVEGYQMHWDGFSPEDLELSYIYSYESPYGGFVKYDIDRDGTEELLLGDQFENGDCQIYDIFTFNKTTGNIIHLFSGGERNWCTLNGSGVIIETGSNSAEDSFTNCYVLKNLKLKKLGRNTPVTQDLLMLEMDKFINYAKPQQENLCGGYTAQREPSEEELAMFRQIFGETPFKTLSVATQVVAGLNYRFWCRYDNGTETSPTHCFITIFQPLQGEPVISNVQEETGGPEMKVIIHQNGMTGRYIGEDQTTYHGEIQDTYQIEKSKATTALMKACDGQGILTLKTPGHQPLYSRPDTTSHPTGTLTHEQGYIPEVYPCLGYIKGWFLTQAASTPGFIREELVEWDAVNSF